MLFNPNLPSDLDQSRRGRAARLAAALLSDRNREPAEDQSVSCAACGRGMVNRGRRCCSPRCEQWLTDGNPPVDPHLARKALDVPIRAWTVIAGRPDVSVGSRPYADLLDALAEKRANRKVRGAAGKKGSKPQQIEGVDSVGSPRISAGRQEPPYSLLQLFDAELGSLAVRGSDGLVRPDQEWNRRVSPDDVVYHVFQSRLNPTAAQLRTQCLVCSKTASPSSRFCSQACRTAFDEGAELKGGQS